MRARASPKPGRGNATPTEGGESRFIRQEEGDRKKETGDGRTEDQAGGRESANTGKSVERLESDGLFIMIGADAETAWLPPEIAVDERGYVLTGSDVREAGRWELDRDPYLLETSVPGVFACGDVRLGPVKRVAAAVGEGSMAIAFVHQYLREADAARVDA